MDQSCILVKGGKRLCGEIKVQGSKNTVLPIMAASLLAEGKTVIHGCPKIQDVYDMIAVLQAIGSRIYWEGHTLILDNSGNIESHISDGRAGGFRASSLLMGALLSRNGSVSIEKPGGCQIGKRPLNYHFQGFEQLGANVLEQDGRYECRCKRLSGSWICLPFPSVGATENLMLAATRASGVTVITGCAREPEVCDLSYFLRKMGIKTEGAGTSVIKIWGKNKINPVEYDVPYDRIVAATYLFAAMMTEGNIILDLNEDTYRLENILAIIEGIGGKVIRRPRQIEISMKGRMTPFEIKTGPHPGVPTDIQSMLMTAALKSNGPSLVVENIFESRFAVCEELENMGGRIMIDKNRAFVMPVNRLKGTSVTAKDLRGGAALILAGLWAEGETKIRSCGYVKRGYEDIVGCLSHLGAQIQEM